MRRHTFLGAALLAVIAAQGCSSHPPEGTLIEPGKGVENLPGGRAGVSASRAVPITGGTLLVAQDGRTAVAADPDRDRVFIVDLSEQRVTEVTLQDRDEPGRVVEGPVGVVQVALRNGGAVVSIDLASGGILQRRAVCPAPRGLAWDAAKSELHVACKTGELVTLPESGAPTRVLQLGADLRDVIVDGDRLLVTRFRNAEILSVVGDAIVASARPSVGDSFGQQLEPTVAWRTLKNPKGGALMLHQRVTPGDVAVQPGGYGAGGDPCGGAIVSETVSAIDPALPQGKGEGTLGSLPMMAGPGDIALSPDGSTLALIVTGNSWGPLGMPPLMLLPVDDVESGMCGAPAPPAVTISGEPTAVAFTKTGDLVIQSREPATLQVVGGPTITLSQDSRADTGLALFHMNSGTGISCSSCHPEGSEDGRVWHFSGIGARRTQFIGGGVMKRAPFHWDGDLEDFSSLVHEVFVSRMGAPRPSKAQIARFGTWLDTIPAPPSRTIAADVAQRGLAAFEKAECSECHSGPDMTNNLRFDVGTGGTFKVPTLLGIGSRGPYLHTGCADTIAQRFDPGCGGDRHGAPEKLSDAERQDLIAYLEAL